MKRLIDSVKKAFRDVFEIKFIAMMSSLMLTPIMLSHSSLRIVYPDNSMYDVFLALIIYIGFFSFTKTTLTLLFK
ncbi:MAG TPA: hypothetical protein DIT05_08630 [Morganella sp. (in: Bacteria)]|nr:hypothetical protein [Morganella sp. (in: enterobacteria)]